MQGVWRERVYEIQHDGDNMYARILDDHGRWLFVWIQNNTRAAIEVEHVKQFETFISLCGFFSDPHVFNTWIAAKRTKDNGKQIFKG